MVLAAPRPTAALLALFALLAPLALGATARADGPGDQPPAAQPPTADAPPSFPSGSTPFLDATLEATESADPREMLRILRAQLQRLEAPQPRLAQHTDLYDAWTSILKPRIARMLSRLDTWSASEHWSQVEGKGEDGVKDYAVLRVADWQAFTKDAAMLATELAGALKQYANVQVERKVDQRDSPQLVPGPSPEFSLAYPSALLYRSVLDRQAAQSQLGFRTRGSYWRLFGRFNDAWNYWWLGTSKWWKYWEQRQESDRITDQLRAMLDATRETLASTLLGLQVFVGAVQGAEEERLHSVCLACSTDDDTLREMAETALRDMTPVRLEAERFQGDSYSKYGSLLRSWLRRHDAAVRVLDVSARKLVDDEPAPAEPAGTPAGS